MTPVATRRTTVISPPEYCNLKERAGLGRLAARVGATVAFGGVLLFVVDARAATFDCVIDPSLTLKLGSPVPTILDSVEVDRGDFVKQGQVVARLQSRVEQAVVALNRAKAESTADIEAKKANVQLKHSILARKLSVPKSVALVQDVEIAQADYDVAVQDLAQATVNHRLLQLDLEKSKAELEQRAIRSPIDGVVEKRSLGPGEYVHQEANIMTVARIDPLHVETFLPIGYFGQIKVGDIANVRPNDPVGGDRKAVVAIVDQVFDAASGTFGVRLELPNPEHIMPAGLRCRITFDVPQLAAGVSSASPRPGR
jgi:RND family efflux transporter MFP subunit